MRLAQGRVISCQFLPALLHNGAQNAQNVKHGWLTTMNCLLQGMGLEYHVQVNLATSIFNNQSLCNVSSDYYIDQLRRALPPEAFRKNKHNCLDAFKAISKD